MSGTAGAPSWRPIRRSDVPSGVPTRGAARAARTPAEHADEVAAHTLLNCLVREVCGPAGHVSVAGTHLVLRLPRSGVVLRVQLRRRSRTGAHRFTGPAEELAAHGWTALGADALGLRVAAELEARSGVVNAEFAGQLRASRRAVRWALEEGAGRPAADDPDWVAAYVGSEQSLPYGHRFHPTPKARCVVAGTATEEDERTWRRYAPEARAGFPLRLLGVPNELLRTGGHMAWPLDAAARAAGLPAGCTALAVHPWQFEILARGAGGFRSALRSGLLVDLGPTGPVVAPTASVRTLYDPAADVFYKTSLHVRITNCVRRSAGYELRGAATLTRLLAPVAADLAGRVPGVVLLAEPAYRTTAPGLAGGPGPDLADALGVIVREGLRPHLEPGVTPLLSAAVADEYPTGPAHVSHLVARLAAATGSTLPAAALRWWNRYVDLLLPPVLHAYAAHGVLLEPHLQNVLLGVDGDGLPRQVLHRDLEGVKLLRPLPGLPPGLAAQVTYPADRGWQRVAYCVLVNNVGEMAAAVADLHPPLEPALWDAVRQRLEACAAGEPGSRLTQLTPLRALLDGAPLPAKANLLTRWARAADRHARYVPAPNPFRGTP